MNAARELIIVNAPVADVYQRWLSFEELPKFIKQLRDVQRIDDTHFSVRTIEGAKEHRRIIEVIFRNPERRIAWRTISNKVGIAVISFEPQPYGRTEITLKLRSDSTDFLLPDRAMEYLTEFKKLVEANPLMHRER